MEHNKSAAQTRSVRRALSAQWGCEADDNKGAVVPAKSAARENPSTHGENDIDPNDLSLILPDEILLKIFRHLDGRSLARASCVNKRWFYFVRAYEQHLFRPLCKASDWLDVVASPRHRGLAEHFTVHSPTRVVHNSSHYEAANKENIIVTPPRHSDTSKEPNWRLVFAKNTLLRNVWTNADQAELERRRTAQRSLIVPMDTEAWGASLDAFDGHSSRAS
ncbi:uncharacterized protein MONBRDRAFT_29711 [Monosiga brevicollis MX1]|uniref:F-box domain-containing protein n=1 Tax=Monosiga brevicollis TaxID=81824 RepID=A9VBW8_MONBE|nr:uncharacterized protein MONBRDRAFT_29711 [Monosiga brevicollis MX1]EDQ85006.1 predicted protein [Monosiga brevicollis MX1]|eukprot:XP_001750176.1 hypothetical protein [Monosiga brevicollis MX1]